ncbi:MAG: hypothetical protein ACXAD7_04020 [Candidatus Kariarchaeaceae archaeon]|jgi:hypothetical protein
MSSSLIYELDITKNPPDNHEYSGTSNFTSDRDKKDWINLFVKEFNLPHDEVNNFLDSLLSSSEILVHVVLREDQELTGTAAMRRDPKNNYKGLLLGIYGKESRHLEEIITYLSKKCEEYQINTLQITFSHLTPDSPQIEEYTNLGFKKVIKPD